MTELHLFLSDLARDANGSGAQWESYLIWGLALFMSAGILAFYVMQHKRLQKQNHFEKQEAVALKIDQPIAQHPMVDLSRCIGCGSCIDACPEGNVLALVGGKATIVNGLRCVGHGRCEEACPVEALSIGLGDVSKREDIPVFDAKFQSNIEGVYIAGELGGMALVKNAIRQGAAAVAAIKEEIKPDPSSQIPDILVVGAGPAGLSAALAAKQHGLSCQVIDQNKPGGTVLQYPRKKMVLTQPVEIPLGGWLRKSQYYKEELLEIWDKLIEKHELSIRNETAMIQVKGEKDNFQVITSNGDIHARRVVLALGRRGTPRRLEVPGEDAGKVMYQLMDAASFKNEHLLVVGGGDSAVEAAMALASQTGNTVTLSYRKHKFFRIKKRNSQHLENALADNLINVVYNSSILIIKEKSVMLQTNDGVVELPNDYVFIFAGGVPPFDLLKKTGVAFGGNA